MKQEQSNLLDVWRALSREWKKIYAVAEKNMETLGISMPEFSALRHLREVGPSPMVSFARDLSITPAAVTGLVDRLEEKGLAGRMRNEADRRVITIAITHEGEALLAKAMKVHRRFVETQLDRLTDEERSRLLAAFSKLSKAAETFSP